MNHVEETARYWQESTYFDAATREEVRGLSAAEREERFYMDLEFGTGGLRGKIGAGTNRINVYVVRKITQGLADAICEKGEAAKQKGVAIGFDSRRFSDVFARETALVLAANGIKAYLFESLRPVPELSFAVRHCGAVAGVSVTASHNPREYNGYKVYGEDGGQLPPEMADNVLRHIEGRTNWEIPVMPEAEARAKGLLVTLGEAVDRVYRQTVRDQLFYGEALGQSANELKIVYSPLHGSGVMAIPAILREAGFTELFVVPEQEKPDPEFSTVQQPNPENPEAFTLAVQYARERQADIALASDPDSDRLGLYARNEQGEYVRFTGNQIGVVLAWYLLSQRQKLGRLPADGELITTVASTDLGPAVAAHFGVASRQVLVGFKYIGEQIHLMEETGKGTFLFGYEESFGYLAGTHARDKDAVQAALVLSEAAWYYKTREHKTLVQVLDEIQQQLGYYRDDQVSVVKDGRAGKAVIAEIMAVLQAHPFSALGGIPVQAVEDYGQRVRTFPAEGKTEPIALPKTAALRWRLAGGGFVMARPSGTEPKIKFYFSVRGEKPEELAAITQRIQADLFAPIQKLLEA